MHAIILYLILLDTLMHAIIVYLILLDTLIASGLA